MPLDEKRILLDELCEDIATSNVPDSRMAELLGERWQAYLDDPSGAMTLEEFRNRIGAR